MKMTQMTQLRLNSTPNITKSIPSNSVKNLLHFLQAHSFVTMALMDVNPHGWILKLDHE